MQQALRTPGPRRHHQNRLLRVERLEQREVLSSVGVVNGVLLVTGDQYANSVQVQDTGYWTIVDLDGRRSFFQSYRIQQASLSLGNGNDAVNLTGFAKPVTANLGNGADTYMGGRAADTVFAGLGDDTVDGGPGNDRLFSQGGMDVLRGGAGYDQFTAQDGWQTQILRNTATDTILSRDSFDLLLNDATDPARPAIQVIDYVNDHTGQALYQGYSVELRRAYVPGAAATTYELWINGQRRPNNPRQANGPITVRASQFIIADDLRYELQSQGYLYFQQL